MVEKISLVGLGKLGLSLAAAIADSGIQVLGIDKFQDVVEKVNRAIPPIFEPQLEELLQNVSGKTLEATVDIRRAVRETDITFILVQTPSLPDGSYGTSAVESVFRPLCAEIRATGKLGHTIVLCSTIQPGTIRNHLVPMIEEFSGLRVGHGIHIAYNPELVALGSTIKNFREPDFVLIGADHPDVAEKIVAVQSRLTTNNPPVHVMSTASAELVKVGLNTFLTVKISYANLMSQIAARTEGAEIDKINAAIGSDKRIGTKFIKAGPSFGGTCFPRDVKAFIRLCETNAIAPDLANSVHDINMQQDDLLEQTTLKALETTAVRRVCIFGMAFKSATPIIAESAGIKLAERLEAKGVEVLYYDPHATEAVLASHGHRYQPMSSIEEAIDSAPVLVLQHGDAAYANAVKSVKAHVTAVVDCWGVLEPKDLPAGVKHVRLGSFAA